MSDGFDALDKALESIDGVVEKIAAREREAKAVIAVEDCRFRAVGERSAARAFFTSLALGLEPQVAEEGKVETAAVDGKRMLFNPAWVLSLPPEQLYGVVIGHEPMHCAMEQFARMHGMEDVQASQLAADLEINPICREAGFELPPDAVFPGEGPYSKLPKDRTFEEYYALLAKQRQEDGQEGGGDDPGGCGGVVPALDKATAEAASGQWKGRVAAAAQSASERGELPGSLARWVEHILHPKVDPWEVLREYMTRIAKTEQSWARLNRRALARGLYLPSRHSNELGEVVMLVDTSGSIEDEQLASMAGFLEGVLSACPGKLTIIYHTTDVYNVVEWAPEDGPLKLTKEQDGGTSHVPAFQEIENRGLDPAVILVMTDLETEFPGDPGIPTIWAGVEDNGIQPPFGQYVCLV